MKKIKIYKDRKEIGEIEKEGQSFRYKAYQRKDYIKKIEVINTLGGDIKIFFLTKFWTYAILYTGNERR